ncbi:MAG TPA: glycosyltransferase family 4 protein [Methylomirabilota bacterium]|nr:glycosyltransferase family 4 protein [Methylomirabilota bacterium]
MNPKPLHVLHILGVTTDEGGTLSVVRSLQTAPALRDVRQTTVVNARFQQTRKPDLTLERSEHLLGEHPSMLRLIATGLRATRELREIATRIQPDILHAHHRGVLLPALRVGAALKIPVLSTNHSYANRTGLYRFLAKSGWLETVFLTPAMLGHYGVVQEPRRVHVVSACFDDRYLAAPLVQARKGGEPFRIVGVGSIVRWKNWGIILEALRRLTDQERLMVRFHHWGPVSPDDDSRAYNEELKRKTADWGLSEVIRWNGPTQQVIEALSQAHAFIIPSNNEPCSVALMEAMALGLPGIASRSGGSVDIIDEGRTGLLFGMNDAGALAEKLRAVVEGSARLAAPAVIRESVRHRCASAVGAAYRELYTQVVGRHARRPRA